MMPTECEKSTTKIKQMFKEFFEGQPYLNIIKIKHVGY